MGEKMLRADVEAMIGDIIGRSLKDVHKQVADNQAASEAQIKAYLQGQGVTKTPAEISKDNGLRAGRWLRALAAAKGDTGRAADFAKQWGDETLAKALGESTLVGGGALVPQDMADSVIELLRARSTVRKMGVMSVPMPNGSLTLPYLATGATATYTGENQNAVKSEQTFGQIEMQAKKLTILTPISNDLLNDASVAADALVREDLVAAAALREDLAFLRGDGTVGTPKGLKNFTDTTTTNSGGKTQALITTDLGTAILTLETNNVPMLKPGWIMAPRSKYGLMTLLDGNGNLVFGNEMANGTLMGFPFLTTSQIPINLSTGVGSESEVYFADFASILIGETAGIKVDVYDGGAYYDGSAIQSGISRDQTVMRLIARHDIADRQRGKAVHVTDQVIWGT